MDKNIKCSAVLLFVLLFAWIHIFPFKSLAEVFELLSMDEFVVHQKIFAFVISSIGSNLSSSRKLKESTLGLNSIIGMIVAFCGLFPVIVREWQDFYWFFYDVFVLIILFVPWWMWMSVWTEGLELPRGNLRKGQKIHRLIMIMKNKCIMFCKRNWIFIVLFWILQLVRVLFTSVDGVIDWLNCFHAAICLFIYERKSYIIQLPNVHNKSISV